MSTHDHDDETARRLTSAFNQEAETVSTDPTALQRIQRRTSGGSSRSRAPWLVGAFGAAAATAAVITAVVVIGDTNTAPNGSPAATQPTKSATQAVESTEDIYYVGDGRYLYSEPHVVAVSDGKSDKAAVTEFLDSAPLDPDYARGWPDGLTVESITTEADSTTISLRGRADLAAMSQGAKPEAAIQAMVRTAQVENGTVSFVYNGDPVTTLFDTDVSEPIVRLPDQLPDFTYLRAPIVVASPVEGESVPNPVTVTISGNTFEGNVNWELIRDGQVVDKGYVTTAFGEWRQAKARLGTLKPGAYTFATFEQSADDGHRIDQDDKTFTVE